MFFEKHANFKAKLKFDQKHTKNLKKLIKVLKDNFKNVQKQQAKYYNKRYIFKQYKLKNYVWFNNKNIRTKRNKKLKWKIFGFFKIIKIISEKNSQTYRLKLFKRWRIHNVFHVFLLKNATPNKRRKSIIQSTYQVKNIFIEKDEELTKKIFEVKIFLNSKVFKTSKVFNKLYNESELYYLIAWKDYEEKT